MYSRMEEIGYRLHFEETVTCRLPDETEQKQLEITETGNACKPCTPPDPPTTDPTNQHHPAEPWNPAPTRAPSGPSLYPGSLSVPIMALNPDDHGVMDQRE